MNKEELEKQREETKQESLEEENFTLMEKELIKEAKKVWKESHPNPIEMALFGAEWQAERMYSEEEVKSFLDRYRSQFRIDKNVDIKQSDFIQWFEKFKKK